MNLRTLGLSLVLIAGLTASAHATLVDYIYGTTLTAAGSDSAGLNGTRFTVVAQFDTSDVMVNRFGYAAVIGTGVNSLTITGSSIPANNGTFTLASLAFYPTYAGLFTEPSGASPTVTLPTSQTITMPIFTYPTMVGNLAYVGSAISTLIFAPASPQDYAFTSSDGTQYYQSNKTIDVANSVPDPAPIPEPSQYGLFVALVLVGFVGWKRRSGQVA